MANCIETQSRLLFTQWLLSNNFGISLTVLWLFCCCHSAKTIVLVLHMNIISCRVSFVLSYFYKSTSSCLCHDKNGLAELWPRTNTHGSKILDFNACHILPPKYPTCWRFWAKTSPMPSFLLNGLKRLIWLWNLPWLFRFTEISPFPLSMHCFWNTTKLYFGSTSVLKSSFPLHRRPKILLVNLWQLMTASNVIVRTQVWNVGSAKILGFVCKFFLPFFTPPPPLPTLLLAPFFPMSLTLVPSSLLQSRKEALATEARPWTTSSPKNSLSSPTHPPVCDKCRLYTGR